jgi:hypothetical protein
MKSIIINQLDPPVDIYGASGMTGSTLIVSGWTGTTYTLTGITDDVVYYTVRIVKVGCDDLTKTFQFTITPTPTPTPSITPSKPIVITWEATECNCETKLACPEGYTLSSDGYYCYGYDQQTPTHGTTLLVNNSKNQIYSSYGAKIYKLGGYTTDGAVQSGYVTTTVATRPLWGNGLENLSDGRLNKVGIWGVDNCTNNTFQNSINEWIGVSATITIATSKIYYIGIAGDNTVRLVINGYKVVEQTNIFDESNSRFWHIYPVILQDGDNYIEVSGRNYGFGASFGGEIYDNTEAELIAATKESDLKILFSTQNFFCKPITVSATYGYSCNVGYSLDTSGNVPVCKRRIEIDPTKVNTGYIHCVGRRRLANGVPDGYQEENTPTGGLGPYFPDTLNPTLCPVGSVDPTPTPSPSVTPTKSPIPTPSVTPSASAAAASGCIIYAIEATVQSLYVSTGTDSISLEVVGLNGGTYGVGGITPAFSIGSATCRPCTTRTASITMIQRGTLAQFTLGITFNSTGTIVLSGTLPTGFLYDGGVTVDKGCTSGGCLIKGTRITLADGSYKLIEDVVVGDVLMSLYINGLNDDDVAYVDWSSTTLSAVPSTTTVRSVKEVLNRRVYKINGVLVASGEHRHFIRRGDQYYFERADAIKTGDYLLYEQGGFILVNNITIEDGLFTTYLLDVEDLDVYYANGLLTHNKALPTA